VVSVRWRNVTALFEKRIFVLRGEAEDKAEIDAG
jgi:hypothetical protein